MFLGIDSLFSGNKGMGFKAKKAKITPGVNSDQINQGYQNTQSGIRGAQDLVSALNNSNGVGNQANTFNSVQNLTDLLTQQAQGGGPNPAGAMLSNATGENVANQAALMASQRGASANPGMIAHQAALAGGRIQQQAAGQAALLQAQQQLAAQQALQNNLSLQGQIAGQQVGQHLGGVGLLNQSAQGAYGIDQNALSNQNAQDVAMQSNVNNANAGIQGITAQGQQKAIGGLLNGLASAGTMYATGGTGGGGMPMFSQGGMVGGNPHGPKSMAGQHLYSMSLGGEVAGQAKVSGNSYKNDKVPALLSPKEIVLPRSVTMSKDAPKKAADFVAAILGKNSLQTRAKRKS